MAGAFNLDPQIAWLEQFVESFDFKRPGRDQSLGRDVAMKIVEGIHSRISQHVDPEGEDWPENSTKEPPPGGYKAWKAKKYGLDDEPNIRTGQMTSQTSLYGRTQINTHDMLMVYGLGEGPKSSAAPTGYLSKQDKETTDTQKAYYAHTGQSKKRVLRKFYAANAEDTQRVIELVQENLNDYIRSIFGP
jgi:hypothetical protein